MIGRLARGLSAAVVYFAVATLLAQAIVAAFLWWSGRVDRQGLAQIGAVLQGVDLLALADDARQQIETVHPEQPSYADVVRARALRLRELELREQATARALDEFALLRGTLNDESQRQQRLIAEFRGQLDEMETGTLARGRETVREIWESIQPRQAKEQIIRMVDDGQIDEVVAMLVDMPVAKTRKIVGEFRTPDEVDKLGQILDKLRLGVPEIDLIENARQELAAPGARS